MITEHCCLSDISTKMAMKIVENMKPEKVFLYHWHPIGSNMREQRELKTTTTFIQQLPRKTH